jgi:hypothetical protein
MKTPSRAILVVFAELLLAMPALTVQRRIRA